MKKTSSVLLFVILYSFPIFGQGFLNKLMDRGKEAVERISNSNNYENLERTIRSINPTEYLSGIIGSRLRIQNPFSGLNHRFTEIQNIIDRQTSLFTNDNTTVQSLFKRPSSPSNFNANMSFLKSVNLYAMNSKLKIDGREYTAYMMNGKILLQSTDNSSIPLNDDLQKGIKVLLYKASISRLNGTYIRNLQNISQIAYTVSSTSYSFSSMIERQLNNIGNLEYGGVTAIQILDPITEASTGGISYSDITSFTGSLADASRNTMNVAKNIQRAAQDINSTINRLNNNVIDYQSVIELENGLNTISTEVRNLASSINEISSSIKSSSGDFTQLV
ncbi:MAG: hypothetical protein Q8N03_07135 [Ignavibacteria bacterium]|nr:hypothetical protein [Ignavibacteria bacterium]MDP3831341.1 hypothetical protein [Ignavibacteriaceae bacterium]